ACRLRPPVTARHRQLDARMCRDEPRQLEAGVAGGSEDCHAMHDDCMIILFLCIGTSPEITPGTHDAPIPCMLDSDIAMELIRPHMPVVCSDSGVIAMVDHVEDGTTIKLTQDASGHHHYIPLTWVSSVDDKVHLDRPKAQIQREWSTTP